MYVRSNARVRILRRSKLTMFQSDLHLCFIYAIAKRICSEYAHILIVFKLTFYGLIICIFKIILTNQIIF